MHIRIAIFGALFLFAAVCVSAQDWSAVQGLKPGSRVYVTTKAGSELKGKIGSVTDSIAQIRVDGRLVPLNKDEILTIHLSRRGSIVKRALIGAAAGAGIGTAVGVGVVAATKSDGLAAAGGFLYGIPLGAAVGAVTTGNRRGKLIYSSR